MLRFDNIVFGPIHSRRLGSSLGINLLPQDGKLCNFDCIYCECGWNRDGRTHGKMPVADEVAAALEAKLQACALVGTEIDSITFSGNGEPTLNPDFPEIIDRTVELRDKFYPKAKISVLSNATTLAKKDIFLSLKKIDNPILKLDSVLDEDVLIINRPSGRYDVNEVIGHLADFDGDFVLQTMFLTGGGVEAEDSVKAGKWMDVVRRLRPREVMVYTIDRETPEKDLKKLSVETMRNIVKPLIDEGFNVRISG